MSEKAAYSVPEIQQQDLQVVTQWRKQHAFTRIVLFRNQQTLNLSLALNYWFWDKSPDESQNPITNQ